MVLEDSVHLAKLAKHAERYEEMVENMKAVAPSDQELSVERNLLFRCIQARHRCTACLMAYCNFYRAEGRIRRERCSGRFDPKSTRRRVRGVLPQNEPRAFPFPFLFVVAPSLATWDLFFFPPLENKPA